jgi:hypothetical protein
MLFLILRAEVEKMKFILTDELREHMDSKELKGISLVTKIRSC